MRVDVLCIAASAHCCRTFVDDYQENPNPHTYAHSVDTPGLRVRVCSNCFFLPAAVLQVADFGLAFPLGPRDTHATLLARVGDCLCCRVLVSDLLSDIKAPCVKNMDGEFS